MDIGQVLAGQVDVDWIRNLLGLEKLAIVWSEVLTSQSTGTWQEQDRRNLAIGEVRWDVDDLTKLSLGQIIWRIARNVVDVLSKSA